MNQVIGKFKIVNDQLVEGVINKIGNKVQYVEFKDFLRQIFGDRRRIKLKSMGKNSYGV